MQALQLESFLRPVAPPPAAPVFDADDMATARAEGRAEGLREGQKAAALMLAAAVDRLAEQLADEDRRQTAAARHLEETLAEVAQAIIAALAAPLRAETLTAQICATLAAEIEAGSPVPPRLRCETSAAPVLRAALDAGGLGHIAIDIGESGAEFALPDGLIRIDPDRVQAALMAIVAEVSPVNAPQDPTAADTTQETSDE